MIHMAAAPTTHLKFLTKPIKPKRRRCRETTITTTTAGAGDTTSSAAAAAAAHVNQNRRVDTPTVVHPDGSSSCCCPASKPPAPPPLEAAAPDLKIRYSPSSAMDSYQASVYGGPSAAPQESFPSSLSKFNSALTAGLLNPMSPPPPADKTRSSPTLFEMMANEPECLPRTTALVQNGVVPTQNGQISKLSADPSPQDNQALVQQRLMDLIASRSPGSQFNDPVSGDVKLTLSARDGINVSMSVHRQILVAHSRFFALKLNEKWAKQQRSSGPYIVEIADCEDIEVYIETMRLMYCKDLRRKLTKEVVPCVLGILKASAAIGFDAGVLSCLEYLEAAPWTEDEEEKVASLLSELRLEGVGAGEVLKRVSLDVTSRAEDGSDNNSNEQVLLKLLQAVLEGKDEKARREMKSLITKMLRDNSTQHDLRKESLYSACNSCLKMLRDNILCAADKDTRDVVQIARQADNLHWLLDIMIDRQIAEDFLSTWASQIELSEAHSKVPAVHRYEVSRVTARFFVGIGKGQLLASKEARCSLLRTWLGPFYEDFGWMRRGLDRHLVEEGLGNTILTLPMPWQKEIMMSWFDRFLSSGDECPNIQRGFEVWWRRSFSRRGVGGGGEAEKPRLVRIMSGVDDA